MEIHHTLAAQVKKHLSEPGLPGPVLDAFLQSVSSHYYSMERDKRLTEHAFEVSEKEYQDLLSDLRRENDLKQQSISKIKAVILALDANSQSENHGEELLDVIQFLERQIIKTKILEEELLKAKEIAESSSKAKSNFLSVMSHEIRTPLNAIIGFIHLLSTDPYLQTQEDYLKAINISSQNLLNLVNDILDFSKIEEGKIEFLYTKINIKNLIHEIKLANMFKANERENKITVMLDEDLPSLVMGDEVRLSQILNNLISNAIKFTHRGQVLIEITKCSESAEYHTIQFVIKDTGVGIPSEATAIIFERFTQANSEIDRQYGGSGLGLSIVKKLLELQGKSITVESTPGKGSCFTFSLDFAKCAEAEQIQTGSKAKINHDLSGIKVLLVEDVYINSVMARSMLINWKAEVDLAENGQIAIEMCKQNTYDIILMDLQMPVMDGITATLKIRDFNTEIPIVALTASSSFETQIDIKNCGMDDFIAKPFNPYVLFETIKKKVSKSLTV